MDPSKSQVTKSGRVLRRAQRGEAVTLVQVTQALTVIQAHRANHQQPLTKATMGLRSMVRTEGCATLNVSQRLKRLETIVDKLRREPTLALAKMQDIAGCRAVLSTIEELRRVERRLKRNRPPISVSDYIGAPRPSGYRGVHVVVKYDGYMIEVQLRTQVMHDWAIAVERLGGRINEDIKSGKGPPELQELMARIAEAMAIEESGAVVDATLLAEIERLRIAATPYLARGARGT